MSTPDEDTLAPAARLLLGRELRANLRTFFVWLVPVGLLIGFAASLQPSMSGDGGVLAAKLAAMPEAMRRAFGMAAVDFNRPAAYLAVPFLYVTLSSALLAAALGAGVIAKEESQRTAELLYTLPAPRARVLAGKAAAVVIYVLAFNIVLAMVALAVLAAVASGPVEPGLVASMFTGTAALALCFAGTGMLVATLVPSARIAGNVALGVTFAAYLIAVVTATSPRAEVIGNISPFRHVEAARIVAAGGVDPVVVALLAGAGALAAIVAIRRYERRDIPT